MYIIAEAVRRDGLGLEICLRDALLEDSGARLIGLGPTHPAQVLAAVMARTFGIPRSMGASQVWN